MTKIQELVSGYEKPLSLPVVFNGRDARIIGSLPAFRGSKLGLELRDAVDVMMSQRRLSAIYISLAVVADRRCVICHN